MQNTSAAGKTVLSSYGTPEGRRINVSYNGDSRIREIDDPASGHRYYTYTNGLLTRYSGPNGVSTYTYNAAGHMTSASLANGTGYTIVPLADGRTQSLTVRTPGAAAQTWSFSYGAIQTTVTNPDGSTTPYAFDDDGEVLEDPDVLQAAAEAYASDYNTSIETARAWMIVQDRSAPVGEQIGQTSIRDGYAGVWYDNDTRRVKLNLINGTPTAPAHQVLQSDHIDELTDIVMVTHTQEQIDNQLDSLTTRLTDIIAAGHLRLSRDTEHNAVLAEIATTATAGERSRVQAAAANASVKTSVTDAPEPDFDIQDTACGRHPVSTDDGFGLACDPPVRGGVRIDNFADGVQAVCTVGFTAVSLSDLAPYVFTSGHCLSARNATDWQLRQPGSQSNLNLGPAHRWIFDSRGDVGIIRVTNPAVGRPFRPLVFFDRKTRLTSRRNPHFTIRRSSFSREKQYVCVAGATSGSHCGRITRERVTGRNQSGIVTHNLGLARICGIRGGDSGGSVVRGRSAVGLIKGSGSNCAMTFNGANGAEAALNVKIVVPRLSPRPQG